MKPPLTKAESENIADRYLRGQSIKFISFALSRSIPVVKAALKEHGIRVERHRVTNRNWAWTGEGGRT